MITIDTEKAIIYGEHGSSSYYINDLGGLELTDIVDGGLTEEEISEAFKDELDQILEERIK